MERLIQSTVKLLVSLCTIQAKITKEVENITSACKIPAYIYTNCLHSIKTLLPISFHSVLSFCSQAAQALDLRVYIFTQICAAFGLFSCLIQALGIIYQTFPFSYFNFEIEGINYPLKS